MATSSNWWMFHGDAAHTGEAAGSPIDATNVANLKLLYSINVNGSILSTPAVVDGYVYVGLANSLEAAAQTGGQFLKVDLASGQTVAQFTWDINPIDRDSHGFCGMGCTPAVANGKVYFSAFDGKVYCLNQSDLTLAWRTDLRYADMAHNQPVTNDFPNGDAWTPANPALQTSSAPKASGWSSPLVVNDKIYVGIGEGENPYLYGFVYCLDANSGDVVWIYCTCQFQVNVNNLPNQLPAETILQELPPMFTTVDTQPVAKGASVWSGIAYDPDSDLLYAATGNPNPDGPLPTAGYSNSVLILNATTGAFQGVIQIPAGTFNGVQIVSPPNAPYGSYRPSDTDVDIGGAPTIWKINEKTVVGIGCKNGCYMVFDPTQINAPNYTPTTYQLLPTMNDGSQISTVDPHFTDGPSNPQPVVSNQVSNQVNAENYHGTYSTAALCTPQQKLFIGVGGNNYHYVASGIDSATTPFIRALDWNTLKDAWPLDGGDPQRYKAASDPNNPLYKNSGESGISVPAVVNDVVFMSTTLVALYAFKADDGTLLWSDTENFGSQTGGMSGGYGYCMGPAISGNYVVAGALVLGGNGGVLNIYALPS
ncbi:MAG: quinohemoprotein ethanol dehydrogenase [Thermoanaerobaculia bacterium]|jgi:outer membrane protein assembly factor BamB|nr:quinohemoprotein ethanol dehydrogenase [Thermoanaerobaculia bacterium]